MFTKKNLCAFVCLLVVPAAAGSLRADFHLMRISEIMFGAGGDPKIQFIELQMTSAFQGNVSEHEIFIFDAAGTQVSAFPLPADVPQEDSGDFILIGTPEFAAASTVAPDFVLPAGVYFPASGRVAFEGPSLGLAVDSIAYGAFTGTNSGYGTPATPPALAEVKSLQRTRTAFPPNNSTDYTPGDPTPTRNSGQSGTVNPPKKAPAISPAGLFVLSAIALGLGALALRRRRGAALDHAA